MPPAALPGLEARAAVLALAILIAGAPLAVLRNEGPGYGVERMESIKLRPRRSEMYPG